MERYGRGAEVVLKRGPYQRALEEVRALALLCAGALAHVCTRAAVYMCAHPCVCVC